MMKVATEYAVVILDHYVEFSESIVGLRHTIDLTPKMEDLVQRALSMMAA